MTLSAAFSQFMASPLPMLGMIFVVFYFFLIRPQQQKAKQLKAAQAGLRRGDKVITAGGIIGSVSRVINDEEIEIAVAENVKLRIVRSTIPTIVAKTEPVAAKPKPAGRSKAAKDGEPAEAAAKSEPAETETASHEG